MNHDFRHHHKPALFGASDVNAWRLALGERGAFWSAAHLCRFSSGVPKRKTRTAPPYALSFRNAAASPGGEGWMEGELTFERSEQK
jgi:hypothetical protein